MIDINANEETGYWKYWAGWKGNHDKRIEGATCSNCGFVHPTVYGSLSELYDFCPKCKAQMISQNKIKDTHSKQKLLGSTPKTAALAIVDGD